MIMRKYPVHVDDIISKERIEKGRTHIVVDCKELVNRINEAFYDGFILSLVESKEDLQGMTAIDRAFAMAAACDKLQSVLYDDNSGKSVEWIEKTLKGCNSNE